MERQGWEFMVTLGNPSGWKAFNVRVSLKDNDKRYTVAGALGEALWLRLHLESVRGFSLALGPLPIFSPAWKMNLFLRKA